ncbi:zona pellucida sperm-binding protein 1-like isoform X2 [Xiphias gladius]|uniref:zona pellucida sperm-binding protein 1-like isoform X2 n=1 Tax=Xiphias gladius TaxID=8245 RepID=UPI001A986C2D|nr:zona pellucida sperm-binding protein 1-like isoform X2 [Xiphias gladius]
MAKHWRAASLVALAFLGCLVGTNVEAQDLTWQKPALPMSKGAPPAQTRPLPQPPPPPKAPQFPQVLPVQSPLPRWAPQNPQNPQVPQVQRPPPPTSPKYPQNPQVPQVQRPPPPTSPQYPQNPQVPQVQRPPPPTFPQYPQNPQVPQVQPPQPPQARQYDQVPQVLQPPLTPKVVPRPQAPKVLPPPLPPKVPHYPQVPQVQPPPPPKVPRYPQVPQVQPPPPPKPPTYPQVPQVQPPPPPKPPTYPQVPQVQPPPPPKVSHYPQVPQVQPPPPPKPPTYPQAPKVTSLVPPNAPQYPQIPQVRPHQPQVRPLLPPPSPPRFPQYPQAPKFPGHPRAFSNFKSPQKPEAPQPQQPHQPTSPQASSTYPPGAPQQPSFQSCEVAESQRVPCGGRDISAAECEAISCCFDGRQCYFGKAVTVQCTKDAQFIVVVAKDATLPNIDLESISLLEGGQGCTHVDSNSDFAIYHFPVTACGSLVMEEPGVIIYENRMSSSYEVGLGPRGAITRDSFYELQFRCRYIGTSVEAVVAEVLRLQDPPLSVAALGPIRVHLRLANGQCYTKGCNEEDVAYSSFYTEADYPVIKVLRDPVYVEVQLIEKTDPNLVLTLGRCWTTTSPNPHSLPQWDILTDGCPWMNDRYLSSLVPVGPSSGLDFPSHYRRFIFKMFTFVDANSLVPLKEQVYIHCSTAVCTAALGHSCEPSCFRRKRDVETADQSKAGPKVVVSVGPVIMTDPKEQPAQNV